MTVRIFTEWKSFYIEGWKNKSYMSAVETRDNCGVQTIQIILFIYSILVNCKHLQTICNCKDNIVSKSLFG